MVTWPKNYGKPSNTTVTRKNITVIRLFEKFDHCSSLVRSCAWCVVSLVWWPRPRTDHLILRGRDVTVTGSEFPTLFLGVMKGKPPLHCSQGNSNIKATHGICNMHASPMYWRWMTNWFKRRTVSSNKKQLVSSSPLFFLHNCFLSSRSRRSLLDGTTHSLTWKQEQK